MTFLNYFWEGSAFANKKYCRNTHIQDTIRTLDIDTYSYKGLITAQNEDGSSRVIDHVVQVNTVSAKQREEALAMWNSLYNKSMGLTLVGITGTTASVFCTFSGVLAVSGGLCLGVPSGILAIWSITRLDQASQAFTEWQDPITYIRNLRVTCAKDFISLKRLDLRNKVFTANEVKNIYIEQFITTRENYSISLSSGDPNYLIAYTKDFFERNNLLSMHLFDYAFKTNPPTESPNEVVSDEFIKDIHTSNGFRRREFINAIHETESLAQKYMYIEKGRRDELATVEDYNTGGHLLIHGGHVIANDNLHRRGQRDAARNTSLLAIAGHVAMEGYSEMQRNDIERRAQSKFLHEFSTPLASIFRKVDEAKIN